MSNLKEVFETLEQVSSIPANTFEKGNNSHSFDVYSIEPMTAKDADVYQSNRGYSPWGYGLYSFRCEKLASDSGQEYYHSSWRCSSSCD
jgi:hypothetical protein